MAKAFFFKELSSNRFLVKEVQLQLANLLKKHELHHPEIYKASLYSAHNLAKNKSLCLKAQVILLNYNIYLIYSELLKNPSVNKKIKEIIVNWQMNNLNYFIKDINFDDYENKH